MTRFFGCLLVVLSLVLLPSLGCNRGPEKAGEQEALEGMDDMTGFEDASGGADLEEAAGGEGEGGGEEPAAEGDAPAGDAPAGDGTE